MLKKKLKFTTILLILFITLIAPIVNAENKNIITTIPNSETKIQDGNIMPINQQVPIAIAESTYKNDDEYLFGEEFSIDYNINGNVFVISNEVTINSEIRGDVFIYSDNITIEDSSYIYGNVFALGQNIIINGTVSDLYAISQNVKINGNIIRDIKISSNDISLLGNIGKNAYISSDTINFNESYNSKPAVSGNLNYSSTQEISIPENAVSGEIHFDKKEVQEVDTKELYLRSLITFIVTTVIIWLICLWIARNFLKNCSNLIATKKIFYVIGLGILAPLILVALMLVFLLLRFTFSLGLIALAIFCILLAISTSMFSISISTVICEKLKISKFIYKLLILIVCSTALSLCSLIPYINSIIKFLSVVTGLGVVVSNLVLKKKAE